MATVTLKGITTRTSGYIPAAGTKAPDFTLTTTELGDVTLKSFLGKKVILNIFPSIDTPVCSQTVRRFNEEMTKHQNVVVMCISADLPFAQKRFCAAEGIENVVCASEMRNKNFGNDYGVRITDGPLCGLLARAVVVISETGRILHNQLVSEIAEEPDYKAVFSHI